MNEWADPLLDSSGMRAVDRWAIEERGIPSIDLMERAGRALAEAAAELVHKGQALVLCGKGNNGGDGLVAARYLHQWGVEVDVYVAGAPEDISGDAALNRDRLPVELRSLESPDQLALPGHGVIVDALLGTGFAGSPRNPIAGIIGAVNQSRLPVVSADVPSGVDASTGQIAEGDGDAAVAADLTVTFHAAKVGHWVHPGKELRGELRIAGIGIPPDAPTDHHHGLISERVLDGLPRRNSGSTKFTSGSVLVIGGSPGLTGAVRLAAQSAIRAGAGYASVAVPSSLESVFELTLTEVMSVGCPDEGGALGPASRERIEAAWERADTVALGPGIGRYKATQSLVRELARDAPGPLVVDADGLNAIAAGESGLEVIARREGPTLLTPHAGELARLLGRESRQVSARRLSTAREAAERSGALVVLKGDDTIIARHDGCAINSLPSPALATAGTGDVLCGVAAAILARGVDPMTAAAAAVLGHSRAGRIAAAQVGSNDGVVARDVIAALPAAMWNG